MQEIKEYEAEIFDVKVTETNKILKNLESKKLIKAVKSVAVSSWLSGIHCAVH